ncbi:hypothetical protein FQR65_LT07774 [Abscondita terminalis]|nr:hypothetical protein FQR65_LT07774 [Abscondita terminalis]
MEPNYLPIRKNFATLSIHSGKTSEKDANSSIVPPLVSSINYKVDFTGNLNDSSQRTYSRKSNPTRDNLEHCLATLEGGKYGVCFSSGIGALSSLLALLEPGSHIICSNAIFGGTVQLLVNVAKTFSFTTSFVDIYDLKNLESAIQSNTSLIWVEPISNPLLKVADIQSISKIAKELNILFGVDNTFLTSYFHRPLELGADVVSQSLSKYVNGHSDVIMGAIVVNRKDLYDKLKFTQNAMGIIPSPVDCAQVLRSLKTLPLRMRQHHLNAMKVAQYLQNHKKVTKVIHPGLPSHPQHNLFKSQTSGHSGLIAFYIDGDLDQTKKLLNNFKLITPTTSLGSVESIAEIPILMSQSVVPIEIRGPEVTNNLIRLSVGLEDDDDIIQDLEQALEKL